MTRAPDIGRLRFRSIFISDVHLGSRSCRAELLLDFLARVDARHIFLVGDILDLESLSRSFYWPTSHAEVVYALLRKAREGTRVSYVPGNHDAAFRHLAGQSVAGIEVHRELMHTTADGRRLLVLHGDEFERLVRCNPILKSIGARIYGWLLGANDLLNFVARRIGLPDSSFARRLKMQSEKAASYIARFERIVAHAAARRGVDAVVCGHIHHASKRRVGRILYCNDGDWVESCTALVELHDGRLELVEWSELAARTEPLRADVAAA